MMYFGQIGNVSTTWMVISLSPIVASIVDRDAAARGQFGEQEADAGVGRKNIEEGIAWIGRWRKTERRKFMRFNEPYEAEEEGGPAVTSREL